MDLIKWNIYEIRTVSSSIVGQMVRGRLRKFAIQQKINLLTENASEEDNLVRFAVLSGFAIDSIKAFLKESIAGDISVALAAEDVLNPVLSKLKVNDESRYTI